MLSSARNRSGGAKPSRFFLSRSSASGRAAQAAFTLIELVVVLVLMGTLAALALPRMDTDTFKAATEAQRFASALRYAQSLAMTQGQRHLVQITAPRSYVFKTAGGTQVKDPFSGTSASTQSLDSAVSFGTLVNITASIIGFDGRGVPYTNSPLAAASLQMQVPVAAGGATRTVTIDPETGRVDVQ